jgi:hypothetical protein
MNYYTMTNEAFAHTDRVMMHCSVHSQKSLRCMNYKLKSSDWR